MGRCLEGDGKMITLDDVIVNKEKNIIETMKIIDHNGLGIAIVCNEQREVSGVVTDGDIRRAIIMGCKLNSPIFKITNLHPLVLHETEVNNKKNLKDKLIKKLNMKPLASNVIIPVVNKKNELLNIISTHRQSENELFYEFLLNKEKKVRNIKKVLIIGGAGYLGSVLSRELLKKKYTVIVLDNLIYGDYGIRELYKNKNFEFKKGDMRNITDIVEAIKGIDATIHLGALVGDPAGTINPQKTLETNYHATDMIVRICKYHQINRFLFASTCSVYGKGASKDGLLDEESPVAPLSLYAETKIEAEKIILGAAESNFSPTIFRMATIFGYSPRMRFDLVANLLIAKAYFENILPIFGGNQYRPLIHVRDASSAYIKCLETPINQVNGQIFNLGSNDMNYRIVDLGKEIQEICSSAKMELRKEVSDLRSYRVDFSKIKKVLNYNVKFTIQKGAEKLIEKFKAGFFKDFMEKKYSNVRSLKEFSGGE